MRRRGRDKNIIPSKFAFAILAGAEKRGFLYNEIMNKRVCFGFFAMMFAALSLTATPCAAQDGASYHIEVAPSTNDDGDSVYRYKYESSIGDDDSSDSGELNPAAFLVFIPMLLVSLVQPIMFFAVIALLISKASKLPRRNNTMVVRRNFRNATNNPLDGYIVPNAAPKTTGFHYEKQNDASPIQSTPAPIGTAPTILGDAAKPQNKIELDEYGRPKPII